MIFSHQKDFACKKTTKGTINKDEEAISRREMEGGVKEVFMQC
jgi:hypothetical protein